MLMTLHRRNILIITGVCFLCIGVIVICVLFLKSDSNIKGEDSNDYYQSRDIKGKTKRIIEVSYHDLKVIDGSGQTLSNDTIFMYMSVMALRPDYYTHGAVVLTPVLENTFLRCTGIDQILVGRYLLIDNKALYLASNTTKELHRAAFVAFENNPIFKYAEILSFMMRAPDSIARAKDFKFTLVEEHHALVFGPTYERSFEPVPMRKMEMGGTRMLTESLLNGNLTHGELVFDKADHWNCYRNAMHALLLHAPHVNPYDAVTSIEEIQILTQEYIEWAKTRLNSDEFDAYMRNDNRAVVYEIGNYIFKNANTTHEIISKNAARMPRLYSFVRNLLNTTESSLFVYLSKDKDMNEKQEKFSQLLIVLWAMNCYAYQREFNRSATKRALQ